MMRNLVTRVLPWSVLRSICAAMVTVLWSTGSQAAERGLSARMAHAAETNAVLETRETEAKARVRAGRAIIWRFADSKTL